MVIKLAEKLQRILSNSKWINQWPEIDFFLWKETEYYSLQKQYWKQLEILCDRLIFYHLSTMKLLKNEDVRAWFEFAFESLLALLEKNVYNLNDTKKNGEDIEVYTNTRISY